MWLDLKLIPLREDITKGGLGFKPEDVSDFFDCLEKYGYEMAFNTHFYKMCSSKDELYQNFEWHSACPNIGNFACITE